MKILLLSDLHIEFENFVIDTSNVDIVVLAGDIHTKERGLKWSLENIRDIPVLYVLGNHEFYTKAYPKLVTKLKELAQNTNIHILEKDVFTMSNINFLGCTLWTDFELLGDPGYAGYHCQQVISDYKKIRLSPNYSKLRSIDVSSIHRQSLSWLDKELIKRQGQTNIIITHHAPSAKSLPENYKRDIISSAYASNLEYFILKYQPNYWFHGHIHNSVNYKIGKTSVLSNPKGYPDEENPDFHKLVVEVVE